MDNIDQKKGDILVVDDEPVSLKLLECSLTKAFNIRAASSGEEALQILHEGYNPGVIISDLMMPKMYGTEFLKKAIEIVPDATRILITAHESSKEIINAINKAHAFMFIKKPLDGLALFQAAVVAYDKYLNIKRLKEFEKKSLLSAEEVKSGQSEVNYEDQIKSLELEKLDLEKSLIKAKEDYLYLNEKVATLAKLIDENNAFPHEAALAFSALIRESEVHWFTDHTHNVTIIAKYLAQKLELDQEAIKRIITSALLHNVAIFSLPDDLKFRDPAGLTEDQRSKYFYYFQKAIKILSQISKLKEYSSIIAQIWEHYDGSGNPRALPGSRIRVEAQIIQLANIYHTNVYGLHPDKYQKLMQRGIESQTKAETIGRHKELIKSLYKKTTWFEHDVLNAFQDLIASKECQSLLPAKDNLTINLWGLDDLEIDDLLNKEKNSYNNEIDELKLDVQVSTGETKLVQTLIEPFEVKVGMTVAQNIRTLNGITVVKADTVLTADHVKKIKQFDMQHALDGMVLVLLPEYEF